MHHSINSLKPPSLKNNPLCGWTLCPLDYTFPAVSIRAAGPVMIAFLWMHVLCIYLQIKKKKIIITVNTIPTPRCVFCLMNTFLLKRANFLPLSSSSSLISYKGIWCHLEANTNARSYQDLQIQSGNLGHLFKAPGCLLFLGKEQ